MRLSNEILNELEQLSMVVARISRDLPYQAPEGYFSEFPGKMLALANQDTQEKAPSPDWGKSPVMSVPDGYFEGFASRMMDKIKSISSPDGEDIPSPLLSRIGKNMPYQIPEGYFDTSIPSTVLMGLKDKTVYEVPEGYFETLSAIVVARVQPVEERKEPARVISMGRSRKAWLRYAAAAVVAGFVLTFGWLRLRPHSNVQPIASVDVSRGLTKVSDQDILNFEDSHRVHLQQEEEEEDYANSTASLDITDNDAKSLLGDVPDGELAQYMEEHGDLKDYPTN